LGGVMQVARPVFHIAAHVRDRGSERVRHRPARLASATSPWARSAWRASSTRAGSYRRPWREGYTMASPVLAITCAARELSRADGDDFGLSHFRATFRIRRLESPFRRAPPPPTERRLGVSYE